MAHTKVSYTGKLISEYEYNKLLELQNNKCSICGRNSSRQKFILGLDHNHKTGQIRGLLCSQCNSAIGLLKENTGTMKKAIEYIEKWRRNAWIHEHKKSMR